jgi:WD40 repeat protein
MAGTLLTSASHDKTVRIWDVSDGTEVRVPTGHTDVVYSVAFSPDGTLLASATYGFVNQVNIWDVSDGTEVRALSGHTHSATSVAFSPDGTLLASASSDETVRIWDVSDGTEVQTLSTHSATSVAFSPDGTLLASASYGSVNQVKIWDVSDGTEVRALTGHTSCVRSVAFSPDGTLLASASDDKTVRIWDVSDGTEVRAFGHTCMNSVAFSPDGTLLASATYGSDNQVKIWDVSDGTEVRALSGHTSAVNSVAFSPDGTLLASASDDKTVRIWDVSDGTEVRTLSGHTDRVWSVAFSPDTSLGTSEAEGMVEGALQAMRQAKADFEAGRVEAAEQLLLSAQEGLERVIDEESLAEEEVSAVARSLMEGVSKSLAACGALRSEVEIASYLDGLEKRIEEVEGQIQVSPFAAKRSAWEVLKSLDELLERAMADGHQHLVDRCSELQRTLETMVQRAGAALGGDASHIAPPEPAAPSAAVLLAPPAPGNDLTLQFNRAGKPILGGMAEVYEVTERATGRPAIWKQAAPDRRSPLLTVNKALKNESDILQSLSHPRIPEHIACGQVEDDERNQVNVLVMEKIEGKNLYDDVEVMTRRGRTEEFKDAKKIILEVCEALEYMADQDPPVYHRDIKPHNIIMHTKRGAVLIDFGLAKGVEAGAGYSHTGGAGTEGYKPNERDDSITGAFTDVYSLGQLLWVLLTGERPFKELTPGELQEKLEGKGNPGWLAGLLHESCARHDRRIQTVTEFRIRLENEGELP